MVTKGKNNDVDFFESIRKYFETMNSNKSKLEKLFYDIKSKTSEKELSELFFRFTTLPIPSGKKARDFLVFFAKNNIFVEGEKSHYIPENFKTGKESTFITENEYIKLIYAFKVSTESLPLLGDLWGRNIKYKSGKVMYSLCPNETKEIKIRTLLDDKFLPHFKKAVAAFFEKGDSSVEAIIESYCREIQNMELTESDKQELITTSQELKKIAEKGSIENLINFSVEFGKTIITAAIVGLGVKDLVDARIKCVNTVQKTKKEKACKIGKFIFDKLIEKADINKNICLNKAIKASYEDTRREHDRYKNRFNTPGKVNKIPKSEILKKYLTTYLQETYKDWFSECPDKSHLEYILQKLGYTLIQYFL